MSRQYLFKVEILTKKNHHPLEASAYFSGETQFDVHNNQTYNSTTNSKILWSNIIIPNKLENNDMFRHLPEYIKFRSSKKDLISNGRNTLWKNVHNRENRPDSQFARIFELAIPHFLTKEECISLVSKFSNILINEGMIIDASIHNHNIKKPNFSIFEQLKIQLNKDKNSKPIEEIEKAQDFTAFLTCTLRDYKNGQFVNKNRDWNNSLKLKEWRAQWVNLIDDAIDNAIEATEEEKTNWKKKLNIYPEYKQKGKKKSLISH